MANTSSATSGDSSLPHSSQIRSTTLLPKTTPVIFSHSLSIRLDDHNYLPWKQQVFHAIKGSRLLNHLDSSLTPPKFLSFDDSVANRINVDFELWDQQDSILVSWLLSSMTEKILNRMVGSETTAQIWTSLSDYFTAHNRAKIGQFKTMLRNTKMTGNLDDYLLQLKKIVDTLASIGHTLSPQDHIEAIFNGLSKDYDVFITSVNTRTESYSVAEIEALLLS